MKNYKFYLAILLGVLLFGLGYWYSSSRKTVPIDKSEGKIIRFGYLVGTETAPVLVAKEKGFFEAENLNVELTNLEKQRGIEFSIVGSGVLDGCATSKMGAVKSIAEGVPIKVVGNLLAEGGPPMFRFIVKENSDITNPKGLEDHNFGIFVGGATEYYFDKLIEKYNIDREKINVIPLPFMEMIAAFKADKTDALLADPVVYYEINEEFQIRVISISTEVFSNSIMDGVIFSDEFIQENPDLVKKFMNALFAAGEFANSNPDEVKKIYEKESFSPIWQVMEPMKQAVNNNGLEDGVEITLDWIKSKSQINKDLSAEDIIWKP